MRGLVYAMLLLPLLAACQPQGNMSAHRFGPPSGGAPAYWQVPAYPDRPLLGPDAARGVLLWSHGLRGRAPSWTRAPQPFVERFARAGWDVVKVNRNNLHENYWAASGARHVADLRDRARKARAEGYDRVVLGGFSFGGALSLEAASEPGLADGVLAMAPGHGSDACGTGSGQRRLADNLPRLLANALERNAAPRAVLMLAKDDECMGFNNPHAQLRRALAGTGVSFVFLDDSMPIRGHAASETGQFDRWYGQCLVNFLDAKEAPRAGETVCAGPNPVPAYLLPDGYAPPAAGGPGSLVGAWGGNYAIGKLGARNICILVEREFPSGFSAWTAFGSGSRRKASMVTHFRHFSRRSGGGTFVYAKDKYSMTVVADGERRTLSLTIRTEEGNRYRSRLRRGCKLVDDWPPTA